MYIGFFIIFGRPYTLGCSYILRCPYILGCLYILGYPCILGYPYCTATHGGATYGVFRSSDLCPSRALPGAGQLQNAMVEVSESTLSLIQGVKMSPEG